MGGRIKISLDQADRRLDRILRTTFKDVPLGQIMKSIRTGAVRVDGKRAKADARMSEGAVVDVPWSFEDHVPIVVSSKEASSCFDVLYRDDGVMVVDKHAGVLSQPSEKDGRSVITDAWEMLSWTRNDFRPALIGRLDRNVSGVMVIALNAPMLRTLSALVRDGRIKKIYRAVVIGEVATAGEISVPLLRDAEKNISRPDRSGERAITRYRRLSTQGDYSLVELELVTGRHHQLRAHLSHIGHPIAGDVKYGGKDRRNEQHVQHELALHAFSICLPNIDMAFEAPMPRRIIDKYSELF